MPPRPQSWDAFADRLLASAGIAELLVSDFAVPAAVLALDGEPLPGTDLVVEVARTARQLADWAMVMANCIASYTDEGRSGASLLVALRPRTGPRPLQHRDLPVERRVEHRPAARPVQHRTTPRGRFGGHGGLGGRPAGAARPPPAGASPPGTGPGPAQVAGSRPTAAVLAARAVLADACAARVDLGLAEAVAPLGARLGWHADGDVFGAVTALRRTPLPRLAEAVADGLAGGWPPAQFWEATAGRPLTDAVAASPRRTAACSATWSRSWGTGRCRPGRGRSPGWRRWPGPGASKPGVRRARAASGYCCAKPTAALTTPSLPARRSARCALPCWLSPPGTAPAMPRRKRSHRVALSSPVEVPGVPASRLNDDEGPWASAWAGAEDLGAPVDDLRSRAEVADVAALVVPAAWMGRRGWPALWARAHRASRPRR